MASQEKNYYEILEISKHSSQYEIKKSYFNLALKHHPDRNRHLVNDEYKENEEKFKEITLAFKVLYDPIEREKYDQMLEAKNTKRKHVFYSFYSEKNKKLHFTISSFLVNVLNKLFTEEQIQTGKDFFTILKNFIQFSQNEKYHQNVTELAKNFKNFYQEKNNKRENKSSNYNSVKAVNNSLSYKTDENSLNSIEKYVNKNSINNHDKSPIKLKNPLVYNVTVSLDDIYNKVPKELNVARLRKCHLCLGNGYLGYGIHMSLCHICKGLMKLVDHKTFPIDITKKTIVFREEGSEEENGELNDLIINVHSKENINFKIINDYDLVLNQKVNLMDLYSEINIKFIHLDAKEYLITYRDNEKAINKIFDKMEIKIPNLGLPKPYDLLNKDKDTNRTRDIEEKEERGELIIKLSVILHELSKDEINKITTMNIFPRTKMYLEHDNLINLKIINSN
jgi:DnaJ-class molecular chaperone